MASLKLSLFHSYPISHSQSLKITSSSQVSNHSYASDCSDGRGFKTGKRENDLHLSHCNSNIRYRSSHHPRHFCRALTSDSESSKHEESRNLDVQSLEQELQNAIAEENYSLAAKIRDALLQLQEDNRTALLAANDTFYDAFRAGDSFAMRSIWVKGEHVQCVHPGAGRICGYDLVMESWELVTRADFKFPIKIDLQNVEAYVKGDVGYVTCLEMVKTGGKSWGKQVASNVFEKVDGRWLLCIHHASHVGV